MNGRAYKQNPKTWRVRLTIADRVVVPVPAGPWLRLRGAWWVASKRRVRRACEVAGVEMPADELIKAAVMRALIDAFKEGMES